MNLGLIAALGVGAFAIYKAMQPSTATSAASSSIASNGTRVALPGVTIPAGVTLSATDVKVARGMLTARYILPNGTTPSVDPGSPAGGRHSLFIELTGFTAAQRLQALNEGLAYKKAYPSLDLFACLIA